MSVVRRGWSVRPQTHVVVLPRELSANVAARGQRLAGLDNVQVLDVKLEVLGCVVILLGDHDALLEEVLVDGAPVGLGDNHDGPTVHEVAEGERICQ